MSESHPSNAVQRSPLRQGLDAARANLVPALLLWATGLAILLGYSFHPPTRAVLEQIAQLKTRFGIGAAIVSTSIVGGLLPVLIQQLMPHLPNRAPLRHLPFFLGFWAYKGMEVDLLYRAQAAVFGDKATLGVIAAKVAVDQLVLCPLWFVPVMVIACMWQGSGFNFATLRRRLGPRPYRERMLAVVVSNWGVWLPAVVLIYALPLPLQVPIQNIVLCIWVLMLMFITARNNETSAEVDTLSSGSTAR